MKEKMISLALSYLFKGYSVIPVGEKKIPLITWKEFQTRKASAEEIVKWWEQYPEAQIGIVTGSISNLTVIDFESGGDFSLIKEPTYEVETGSKGVHKYFQYEKEFKNAVKVFPKTDIRSEGGYVVAAGSTSTKGAYTVINDLPVAKMSENTKKLFLGALRASQNVLPWYASSGQSPYPKISTEGLDYMGSGEGGRNDAMTKFAGSIHAKLHPSLWATIGWQMFEAANLKNSPPLSSYEIRIIWNSIGQKEVQSNPNGRDYSQSVSGNKTWGPTPEGEAKQQRFDDSLSDSSDAPAELDPKETLHASEVADLQVIDSDHTYALDMKPFDDVLLGGFSLGDVVIVAGQTGCGKTTIMQDWSVTLSSGGQIKREKLPSLWFSYEVLARPLWQKFQVMGADVNTPIYMPRFNESGDVEWVVDVIEKSIVKWGIKVVCIDHLGFLRAPRGNYSNAADALTNTVRALKRLAIKRGLIILLPVHVRKTNAKIPDLNDIRDCLPGDQLLYVNGKRVYVKDIKNGDKVISFKSIKELQSDVITDIWPSGVKKIFRLITKSGREIECSNGHKFFALTHNITKKFGPNQGAGIAGWTRLADLSIGQKVAIPLEYPDTGIETITSEQATLLGWIIGDGHITKRYFAELVTFTLEEANEVKKIADIAFNLSCVIKKQVNTNYYRIYLSGRHRVNSLRDYLKGINFCPTGENKYVPHFIFGQSKRIIGAFLRGLIQADGCFSYRKRGGAVITYSTISKTLADDVQSLFVRVGLMGRKHKCKSNNSGYPHSGEFSYHVDLYGSCIKKFGNVIGFLGYKQRKFNQVMKNYRIKDKKRINPIFFDRIESIEYLCEKETYDISVRGHHKSLKNNSFCVQDIITHNSLGIAQEADTVFFIGREKDDFGLSTNQSKLWLVKNRKTGIAVSATFDFVFGRFYYNADSDKKSESSQTSDAVAALKAYDDWVK